MKIGDIVYVAENMYVIHSYDTNGFPYLMGIHNGVVMPCWFALTPDTPFESKPDNIEWLEFRRERSKHKRTTYGGAS